MQRVKSGIVFVLILSFVTSMVPNVGATEGKVLSATERIQRLVVIEKGARTSLGITATLAGILLPIGYIQLLRNPYGLPGNTDLGKGITAFLDISFALATVSFLVVGMASIFGKSEVEEEYNKITKIDSPKREAYAVRYLKNKAEKDRKEREEHNKWGVLNLFDPRNPLFINIIKGAPQGETAYEKEYEAYLKDYGKLK